MMKQRVQERKKLREEILSIIEEDTIVSELGLIEWLHKNKKVKYKLIYNQLEALRKLGKIKIYDGYVQLT